MKDGSWEVWREGEREGGRRQGLSPSRLCATAEPELSGAVTILCSLPSEVRGQRPPPQSRSIINKCVFDKIFSTK